MSVYSIQGILFDIFSSLVHCCDPSLPLSAIPGPKGPANPNQPEDSEILTMWGTCAPFGERQTSEAAERNPGEGPQDARNAEILWVSWRILKGGFYGEKPRRLHMAGLENHRF